ncbi:MAG: hypothetical protein OEV43_00465 [Coriobacteriia bacterium]|nr:hypothetical protein [Coriobacteriia bacterium]
MPIRYFKCHTLPFPSYDVSLISTSFDSVDVAWRNGPPGAYSAITTHIEYELLSPSSGTSAVTAAGTAVAATLSIAALTVTRDCSVRLRRENADGYGEWTPAVQIATGSSTT